MKINRADYHQRETGDRVSWLDRFADSLAKNEPKTAVEVARNRGQQSIMEQIYSIMGGHRTVDSVVNEMQDRVGLKTYLQKIKADEQKKTVKTAEEMVEFPKVFAKLNDKLKSSIDHYLRNYIKTRRGQVTLPEIQYDLISIFKSEGLIPEDVNNLEVAKYVSDLILKEQKIQPSKDSFNPNIGKGVGINDVDDDGSNSDFFRGLLPQG